MADKSNRDYRVVKKEDRITQIIDNMRQLLVQGVERGEINFSVKYNQWGICDVATERKDLFTL